VFHPGTRELRPVVSDFDRPNGLCFSPDEKLLYIADSGSPHHIRVFDVTPDNTLTNGRVFIVIRPDAPDGIRCDVEGNVWSSAGDGVQVFDPAGNRIRVIPVPERPANLCFGGESNATLFITARTSLYGLDLR
jgi:gluconolactonase